MAHINFVIPQSKAELLTETDEQYFVVDIIGVKEIHSRLKIARQCLNDDGPEFIIDNFDVYYSVLHYADNLQMDTIFRAYEDLHRAAKDLNRVLGLIFEDKDSLDDESKIKYANILKMLLYIYTNIVSLLDLKHDDKRRQAMGIKAKGRKKNIEEGGYICNRTEVLLTTNYILQREISLLWEPPVVDEVFTSMVSEVCYRFLESANIKSDKETCVEIFGLLGTLLKNYNHGMTFVVRLVQLIKIHEHLTACVPEGIQQLVSNYNCKSLVRDLVREITEWQTDEKFTDSKGTRLCSNVLSQMAVLMPTLMIPEVMYLNLYLAHESYTLRNSVLNVIVEVILTVLTKDNLSEEDRESRDEFLNILIEHICDTSAFVRSKIFVHWGRLQTENAIPLKMQSIILEAAILHLRDKGAPVRKSAANCVTIFLTHNLYGSKLQLGSLKLELEKELEALSTIKVRLQGIEINKIKEFEAEWLQHEEPFKSTIEQKLREIESETSELDKEADDEANKENYPELIRMYIEEKKYPDAFDLIWIIGKDSEQFKEMRENMELEEQVSFYLIFARSIFLDLPAKMAQMAANKTGSGPTEEDLKQLEALERTVDFLQDTVTFLEHINDAITPMKELLQSTSVNDMNEAIAFFVAAFQFNIDNAIEGVLEILKLIQRNEQDRKDAVLNAFKNIYLITDSKTLTEHTTIIVSRLINLLQSITHNHMQDLTLILSEWADKGIIDNSVIDMLWQYFTKKIEVTDSQSRASLALLTMISHGRRSTISRNIKLVATIGLGDRAKTDILLATQACKLLSVAGMEQQNLTDKNPPFRIKLTDCMWKELGDLFLHFFFSKVKHFNPFIKASMDCIYRLCSRPEKVVEKLLETILIRLTETVGDTKKIEISVLVSCCILLGEIAIKNLYLLDEVIYKEMKRRAFIREERKNDKKVGNSKKSKRVTASSKNISTNTTNNITTEASVNDDSIMEGAQANDLESEFVMHILENQMVTTPSAPLAQFADIIINICKQSTAYDDEYLQCAATTALLRYMLVSNKFCERHIQLIFTILEKSRFESVKNIIIIHCSDLLEKCPNIIEPYTCKLYERFKDESLNVRKTAFFMLANLILRDMIRVQGYMSEMVQCIIDPDTELKDMAKNFLMSLSQKANNLYNVLPDIFSHLCESLNEKDLQTIMTFIFNLIDKNKQMENLVDRFCAKFKVSDDENIAKNIAYCLSLINYNEKGFKKLIENFSLYKHTVLNTDIFVIFKKIINTYNKPTSKPEMKALTVELDEKIKQMFEITDGVTIPSLTTKKADFKKPKRKGRARRKLMSSGDESDEYETQPSGSKSQKKSKTTKSRGRSAKKPVLSDSSEDSD